MFSLNALEICGNVCVAVCVTVVDVRGAAMGLAGPVGGGVQGPAPLTRVQRDFYRHRHHVPTSACNIRVKASANKAGQCANVDIISFLSD